MGGNFENLKAMYTNADQFLNKKDDILQFIAGNEPNIIMISEVIPKAQMNPIEEQTLDIAGYELYVNFKKSDCNLGASGIRGVAIFVRENRSAKEVTINTDFRDHVWVEISLTGNNTLLCGCIYRSPTNDKDAKIKTTKQVCNLLNKATERKDAYLLICSVFNYREIDWANESASEQSEHLLTFIKTVQECFLYQHVSEPFRYRSGEDPSLLDLILAKEEGVIQNLAYHPGLGDSDHVSLTFDLTCHSDQNERTQSKPNYFKANYGKIRGILRNVDWEDILASTFTDSYGLFVETRYSALEGNVLEHVPRAKKQNVYMNKDSIALKNSKQKLWKNTFCLK